MVAGRPGEDLLADQKRHQQEKQRLAEVIAGLLAHTGLERVQGEELVADLGFQAGGQLLAEQARRSPSAASTFTAQRRDSVLPVLLLVKRAS